MKYLCFSVILWGFRDVETFFGLKNIGNPLCFMESGWGCFSSTTTWPKLGCELLEDDLDLRWLEETLCKNGGVLDLQTFLDPQKLLPLFFPTREKKDGHSLIHFEICVVRLLSKRHSSVWDLCKPCDHLSTPNINECPWKKTVSKGKDHLPLPSFFWCKLLILCWETLALNWSPFPLTNFRGQIFSHVFSFGEFVAGKNWQDRLTWAGRLGDAVRETWISESSLQRWLASFWKWNWNPFKFRRMILNYNTPMATQK